MVHQTRLSSRRQGATIMEVMFAIGVLLFGLLGIAAILPLAGRFAKDSIDLDRGTAIASRTMAQFEAIGFNNSARWVGQDDTGTSATQLLFASDAFVCLDPLMLSRPENYVSTASTNYATTGRRDPWYEPPAPPVGPAGAGRKYYRRASFPYYDSTYNPLINPMEELGTDAWPSMGRLSRATMLMRGSSASVGNIMKTQEAIQLMEDSDRLNFDTPDDDSLPVGQLFRPSGVGSGFQASNRATNGGYSWMATVQPDVDGASFVNVSVVVFRDRDQSFKLPLYDDTISTEQEQRVKQNAFAERVAYVSEVPGGRFVGGTGGSMTLVASSDVSPAVTEGDWIMLIRRQGTQSVHAWYRVIFADRDVTFDDEYVDLFNGGTQRSVWHRNVTVQGSDWDFGFGDDANQTTTTTAAGIANDTLAVIVKNVVSVSEFTVQLK